VPCWRLHVNALFYYAQHDRLNIYETELDTNVSDNGARWARKKNEKMLFGLSKRIKLISSNTNAIL